MSGGEIKTIDLSNVKYATNEPKISIKIEKYIEYKDENSNINTTKLSNKNEVGFKLYNETDKKYLEIDNKTEFKNDNGYIISIKGIPVGKTYTLYETTFPTGIEPKIQPGYETYTENGTSKERVKIATIIVNDDGTVESSKDYKSGNKISNNDEIKGINLEKDIRNNVKYRLKWVEKSTVGKETIVGFSITNRKYINISGYAWEDRGSNDKENTVKGNNKYDKNSNDKIITDKSIRVSLIRRSEENNHPVYTQIGESIYTDKNGNYKIKNLDASNLEQYCVEFDYGGYTSFATSVQDYQENSDKYLYRPVDSIFNQDNTSKAVMHAVSSVEDEDILNENDDSNRKATTGSNPNTNFFSTLSDKLFLEWTNYDDNDIRPTLHNINLGIRQMIKPQDTVTTTLEYVDVSINGYDFKYYYGNSQSVASVDKAVYKKAGGVIAEFENIDAYTREIYPSDIAYKNTSDSDKDLKVTATYSVSITNGAKENITGVYEEKELEVQALEITYDSYIYTPIDENWTGTSGTITYAENIPAIEKDKSAQVYAKFEVNKSALEDLIKYQYITEKEPVIATAQLRHVYKRYDYSWIKPIKSSWLESQQSNYENYFRRSNSWKYYCLDQNGGKEHYSVPYYKNSSAYYFALILGGSRTISGTVFEDKRDENIYNEHKEVQGNGEYDNNENKVENVQVELLTDKTNNIISKLYRAAWEKNDDGTLSTVKHKEVDGVPVLEEDENYKDSNKDGIYIKEEARTTTGKDGKYSFKGVIPGEYYIRFTYGDGSQSIYDVDGNKIVSKVSSDEYKSTIVKDAYVIDAVNGKYKFNGEFSDKTYFWYMEAKENCNMLVDDGIEDKTFFYDNEINYITQNESFNEKTASTKQLSIPVEFTTNDNTNVTNTDTGTYNKCDKMNFGIIKKPEIILTIKKQISNVKVKLQNGQTFLNGNPSTKVPYIANLDSNWSTVGSHYVKAEIDNLYIYGAMLEITYTLTVTNSSDITYASEYYYKYGIDYENKENETNKENKEKIQKKEVQIGLVNLLEYVDPDISIKLKADNESDNNYTYSPTTEKTIPNSNTNDYYLAKKTLENKFKEMYESTDDVSKIKKIYEIGESNGLINTPLYSNQSANHNSENECSSTIKVVATKLMSSTASIYDDLDYLSLAQLSKIKTANNTYSDPTVMTEEAEEVTTGTRIAYEGIPWDSARMVVTPSTGLDRSMKYIIAGIIILITLGGSIVCIKRIIKLI